MENINIQEKSNELKSIVSKYELISFVGFFAYLIRQQNSEIIEDLFESKLKDFQYLIGLRLCSAANGTIEFSPKQEILKDFARRIREIKNAYSLNDFSFNNFITDINYQEKSMIHEFTFNNYFHNGTLSYVEQDIDIFERTFSKLEKNIEQDFGLDIDFLIEFYKYSEASVKQKGNEQMSFTWSKEYPEIHNNAKLDSETFQNYFKSLPMEVQKRFLDFASVPSYEFLKFNKTDYYNLFPSKKIDALLDLFACNNTPSTYLYYTEKNQLDEKPIIRLTEDEYLYVYQKQLPVAFYNYFYNYYSKKLSKEKMQKLRGKVLEEKCVDILQDFFKTEKRTFFYQNYYIENHVEQDILILSNGTAFIIETKASGFREPFRDIDKAYVKIKDDFKENIQKGYEQCERVRKKFLEGKTFEIYNEKGISIASINPQKYYDVFSVIVTQERLGPIQQNLGYLLNRLDDGGYPFSIYINDLEIFLRALNLKTKNHRFEFVSFLKKRELLHERLFCSDELDVCATYLSNKRLFISLADDLDATFTMLPENQDYFDDLYFQGIGLLKNEINLEEKKERIYNSDNKRIRAFRNEDFK